MVCKSGVSPACGLTGVESDIRVHGSKRLPRYCASLSASVSGEKAPVIAQGFGSVEYGRDSRAGGHSSPGCNAQSAQRPVRLLQNCDGRLQVVSSALALLCTRASAFRTFSDALKWPRDHRVGFAATQRSPEKTNKNNSNLPAARSFRLGLASRQAATKHASRGLDGCF